MEKKGRTQGSQEKKGLMKISLIGIVLFMVVFSRGEETKMTETLQTGNKMTLISLQSGNHSIWNVPKNNKVYSSLAIQIFSTENGLGKFTIDFGTLDSQYSEQLVLAVLNTCEISSPNEKCLTSLVPNKTQSVNITCSEGPCSANIKLYYLSENIITNDIQHSLSFDEDIKLVSFCNCSI